jgi:hypothetical protein
MRSIAMPNGMRFDFLKGCAGLLSPLGCFGLFYSFCIRS